MNDTRHELMEHVMKGCLRFTKFCWGWRTYTSYIRTPEYYHETDKLPTQGQPNPRKNRLKVAFGPLFHSSKCFFVGGDSVLHTPK